MSMSRDGTAPLAGQLGDGAYDLAEGSPLESQLETVLRLAFAVAKQREDWRVYWPSVDDLRARLRAVEADANRLDWIEANRACFGHHKETNLWWSRAGRSFKTVRDAIDAAIAGRAP